MTPISQRAYARRRGVSVSAVVKWRKLGRIAVLPDGRIDMETSDALLDARPQVYRGGAIGGTPAGWRGDAAAAGMTHEELCEAVEAAAREYERE